MATTTRDIVSRFIVTDNEILDQVKLIDASLQRMGKSLDQVGGEYDKLEREAKKTFDRQIRAQATFEAGGKQAATLLKLLRELEQATNLDAEAEHRYALRILETRNALAAEMALAKRNAVERQTRAGGGGATPSIGGGAGASDLERSAAAWRSVSTSGKSAIDTINKLSFSIFVLTFGTQQLGEIFLRTFVQVGERVEMQKQRIELLTGSTKTFASVLQASMDVGVSLESFSASFTRLAVANQQMGLANDELVAMTKTITQLGIVGGGTAQEVAAGMQQLAQGFASGRLQGDELRSVMENLPYLAVKMSEKMGIAIGDFRDAGAAGEVTGKRMADAFRELKDEAEKLFNDLPVTSERGLQRIATQWDMMINGMLQAIGTGTVGDFFTGIADSMGEFNSAIAENQSTITAWKDVLGDVAPKLAMLAAAWYLVARPIAGVVAALQAYRVAAAAAVTATAALTTANAAMAAGTATAVAVTEAQTAATLANTAARKAALAFLGPLAAAFTVAAYAAYSYYEAQSKVEEGAQKTIDSIDSLTEKLPQMTRAALQVQANELQKAIEVTRAKLLDLAEGLRYGGSFMGMFAFSKEEVEQQRLAIEQVIAVLASLVGGLRATTEQQEAMAQGSVTTAAAMAGLSKEMKKISDDTRDVNREFDNTINRLSLIITHGRDVGNAMADVADIRSDSIDPLRAEAQRYAAIKDPSSTQASLHALNISKINENTDANLRLNAAKQAVQDTDKAQKDVNKDLIADLDAQISQLEKLLDAASKGAKEARALYSAVSGDTGGEPTEAALGAMENLQKLVDMENQLKAKLAQLRQDREVLGSTSASVRAKAGLEGENAEIERLTENTKALAAAEKEREAARKALARFEGETATLRAGNLEGEARFAAERDAAIAALGESEIKNLEALNDRKLALQEKYVADVKALKQQEIDTLAQDISQTMMSAFTAMADSGDSFNDVLERLAKSFRDMVVQLTVIKPLAQGMAELINGAFGANDSADKTSWVSSLIGGMVKAAFADGGVVGAGLPHGVYSSPTVFPMSSPGHRAFATGTGLLGEAGPEAVLPLKRGANGQLGVQGGGAAVNVVVNTLPGQTATTSTDGNTITIDIIEQAMASRIARGGSSLPKAMEASYAGMRRQGR